MAIQITYDRKKTKKKLYRQFPPQATGSGAVQTNERIPTEAKARFQYKCTVPDTISDTFPDTVPFPCIHHKSPTREA